MSERPIDRTAPGDSAGTSVRISKYGAVFWGIGGLIAGSAGGVVLGETMQEKGSGVWMDGSVVVVAFLGAILGTIAGAIRFTKRREAGALLGAPFVGAMGGTLGIFLFWFLFWFLLPGPGARGTREAYFGRAYAIVGVIAGACGGALAGVSLGVYLHHLRENRK